ncbi:MAG: NAD(P)H-dependent oxidoreductase subunit E [candidate division Zixibacteria bacterium]|jgi:NADH-quinone oxidoreductase E subunit
MILSEKTVKKIKDKLSKYPKAKGAILPSLTMAYKQLGYVDNEIYIEIAEIINVPQVEIAEAASFYTMFPKKPRGKFLLQVCNNISCALLGADAMVERLEEKLAIKRGQTTDDGLFTLISVECLGSCCTAPMIQINDDFHENLTREKLDELLEGLKNGK